MSDDHVQGSPSPSPQPCANGCPFFGSPSTMNMCSKCFSEYRRSNSQEQQQNPASETNTPAASSDSTQRSDTMVVDTSASAPSIPAPTSVAVPAAGEKASNIGVGSTTVAATEDPSAPPPRKVQKNTSRCFSCRKKIGLTGFKCHCGYVFCAVHRYSDKHDCDYDYQASQREHLTRANPTVVASKLEKI